MADIEYIGHGNPDGVNIGRSDDKLGFYGLAAPIAKPTLTANTATAQATASVSSTALVADIASLRAIIINFGMATSA